MEPSLFFLPLVANFLSQMYSSLNIHLMPVYSEQKLRLRNSSGTKSKENAKHLLNCGGESGSGGASILHPCRKVLTPTI